MIGIVGHSAVISNKVFATIAVLYMYECNYMPYIMLCYTQLWRTVKTTYYKWACSLDTISTLHGQWVCNIQGVPRKPPWAINFN